LQVSYGSWSMDYPDVENIYQLFYGPNQSPGPAEASYDNPEMNKLFEQMSVLEPGAKRASLIQKMEEMIQEDCPWAFGYYEASYVLSQPWFMNYRVSEIIANKYKYFRVSKDLKQRYGS
jgi:ABC-type transport system substrate-binding protein